MYQNAPYLTVLLNKKTNDNILCLIQLLSKTAVSYYTINEIQASDYLRFFTMADNWFKKCPMIPISLYYKNDFQRFNYCKHILFSGEYQYSGGFSGANLKCLSERRIKRKIIHLDTTEKLFQI